MSSTRTTIVKAHDQFVRTVFSDLAVARDFFARFLPEDLCKAVDLQTLEPQPSSYIYAIRQESTMDLLYRVKQRHSYGFLYLIVEHQSTADRLMPLRIHKYECNAIDQHVKRTQDKKSVPLVYSIVIYHAPRPYPYSIDIRELVNSDSSLVNQYVPQSRFLLLDLSQMDDTQIDKKSCLGVMFYMLKYIFEKDLLTYILDIADNLKSLYEAGNSHFVSIVLQYAMERGEIGEHKAFSELVYSRISAYEGGKIMTLGEQLRAEGRIEGRTEGHFEEKLQVALRALAVGAEPSFVAEITGLSLEKINALQAEAAH
jgi:recombination-promoting nuclease RpnB